MRKILCLTVVLSLILCAIPSYALELGEAQKTELNDLTIIQGDPDGNLRLGDNITRAECAKIICAIMGYNNEPSRSVDKFPDVYENHWAFNYIHKAKEAGIVNGDEKGNFNPESNITNEEFVKMLVCVLGYSPMADMRGGYPMGYTATASQIGVTESLELKTNFPATRNDVAIMIHRALDVPLMYQTGYGSDVQYTIMDGNNSAALITLRTISFPDTVKPSTPTPEPVTENTGNIPDDIPYYNGEEYTSALICVKNLKTEDGIYYFGNAYDSKDTNTYVVDSNTYVCDYADYLLPLKDIADGKYIQVWHRSDEKGIVHLLKIQIMKNTPQGV